MLLEKNEGDVESIQVAALLEAFGERRMGIQCVWCLVVNVVQVVEV